jgi:hypothetical protein
MSARYHKRSKIKKKSGNSGPPTVFETVDLWANAVHCTQSNWDSHIIQEHPDMAGREADVQKAIEDPDRVSPSTVTGLAYGHEKDVETDTVRAIVYYNDPAAITTGRTAGRVGTAYVVYVKPEAPKEIERPTDEKEKEGSN